MKGINSSPKFFSQDEEDLQIWNFSRKKSFKSLVLISFILFIFASIFLLWGLIITSRYRVYWYDIFNLISFLMIIIAGGWISFTSSAIAFLIKPRKRERRFIMGMNWLVAIIGTITTTIAYVLLIIFVWIPSLSISDQLIPSIKYGLPTILPVIVWPSVFIIWFLYILLTTYTNIIIDQNKKEILIYGRTAKRDRFSYTFPLSPEYQLAIMKYDVKNLSKKYQRWGIFLETETQLVRLCSGYEKGVKQFLEELVAITNWLTVTKTDEEPPSILEICTTKDSA
jgi:MFS family permease